MSAQGHVLTNHHVVENCSSIVVALDGSISQSARVIGRDSKNDLALLTTSGLKPSAVPNLRMGARLGESVFVYGFPLAGLLASSGNFTIGNITAVAGLGDDTTMIQMSAPVQPGNSGGPVLDQNGNVIAVVVSKLNALRIARVTSDIPQNVNFAIKSLIAMSFLEAGNVTASAEASTTKLETTQIADRARGSRRRFAAIDGRAAAADRPGYCFRRDQLARLLDHRRRRRVDRAEHFVDRRARHRIDVDAGLAARRPAPRGP